ncbi:uncharacterized protein [Nicotiana sylvestris]|uniref:uncharacterized protein n=1 Tax=Nicotiana sylvestris TaxID=4096 RepID=UPI00388C6EE2
MSSTFPTQGKPVKGSEAFTLTQLEKTQAHRYVLLNCATIKPFISEFRDCIRRSSRGWRPSATEVERRVNKEFPDWFPKRIQVSRATVTVADHFSCGLPLEIARW